MEYVKEYGQLPDKLRAAMKSANPFYQKCFYDYYIRKGKDVIYFYDSSQVVPLVINSKLMFRYAHFPTEPFFYGDEINDKFLTDIVNISHNDLKLDWIGQTPPSALFKEAPEGAVSIPFGSHIIDLSLSEEELWKNIHSKHRNVIRNAQKHGVIIRQGGLELLNDYLVAEKETMKRSSLPEGTVDIYAELFEKFKNHVVVYVAYDSSHKVQGGAIIVYSRAMAYYMHGASINSPLTGAMNLLQWENIKNLKSEGVSRYSFVGCRINEDHDSKYHGIQNFKKRFGGELFQGRMFKVIFHDRKYLLYKKAVYAKSHGAMAEDIIDQEIHKWK